MPTPPDATATFEDPSQIHIFSAEHCHRCRLTFQKLDEAFPGQVVKHMTDQDDDARSYVLDQGVQQLPYVIAGDLRWNHMRPDMIDKAKKTWQPQ